MNCAAAFMPTDSDAPGDACRAAKGYADLAARYRATLYDLITRAFDVDRESGQSRLSRDEFGKLGREEVETALRQAFRDGLRELVLCEKIMQSNQTKAWVNVEQQERRR